MTEWIDVLVYAAFMLVVWVALPRWSARFTRAIVEDRNAEWAAAHPGIVEGLIRNRWYLRCSYALGALSVAALVAAQAGVWPQLSAPAFEPEQWMVLSDVSTWLLMGWLVYAVATGTIFTRWLAAHVPLAGRRRASLERRSVDTFVPRGVRSAVYAGVGLHLAIWVVVGAAGLYSTPAGSFWGMLASQFLIAAAFLVIVQTIVRRRPNAMDRIFGPRFQRTEVRLAFVAQLLPLMNGFARLREEIMGTASLDFDRASRLALVVFMIASVLVAFGRFTWPSQPESASGPPPSPSSTRASAMLFLALLATLASST